VTPRRPLVLFCLIAAMAPLAAAAQPAPAAAPALAFPGQWAPPPADWKYPVWPNGCTRFEGEERLACHAFIAADFGRLSRYADANRALAPAPPDQTRVVFFGDSITDRWSQPQSGGFFPGKAYVNRGIGGQTTGQMLLTADQTGVTGLSLTILDGTGATGTTAWSQHASLVTTAGTGPDTVASSIEVFDPVGTPHTVNFTYERQDDGSWNILASIPPGTGVITGTIQGLRFGTNGRPARAARRS